MATFTASKPPKPITVDKWYGVNESVGQTEINQGEAIYMRNFRVTENHKLSKRKGRKTLYDFGVDKVVRDMWFGTVGGVKQLLAVVDSKLYRVNYTLPTVTVTLLGSFTVDAITSNFFFGGKLYFLNGTDYKVFDGTTFADVTPYVPTVSTAVPPTGGGTQLEQLNLLTGKKKSKFIGNGTATAFTLPDQNIDATLLIVTINGVSKTETTDFTVNRTSGIVTFTAAPANQSDVVIQWEKASTANPSLVKSNKYASIYGVSNDTTIFLWGNAAAKNRRTFSGITSVGGDPTYWPTNNHTLVGTDDYAITDIVPVYDRQIIFKEDQTFYSTPEFVEITGKYDYPVYPLNYAVGNVTPNGVQLLNNDPVSFYSQSAYTWSNTYVKDERNANIVSDNVVISFDDLDFTQAVTFDNQDYSELWINVGSIVYIYNYGNKAWYMYDNIEANTFLKAERTLYYGDKHGKIKVFTDVYSDDVNTPINAVFKSGFIDFGVPNLNKNTRDVWLSFNPATDTSVDVKFATDQDNEEVTEFENAEYIFLDFNYINFNRFSFLTNRNPQVFRMKPRVKKYAYLQYILSNNYVDQPCDFMNMELKCETAGQHK